MAVDCFHKWNNIFKKQHEGAELFIHLDVALFLPVVLVQTPGCFMQFFTLGLKLQNRLLHVVHQLHVLTNTHTHTQS